MNRCSLGKCSGHDRFPLSVITTSQSMTRQKILSTRSYFLADRRSHHGYILICILPRLMTHLNRWNTIKRVIRFIESVRCYLKINLNAVHNNQRRLKMNKNVVTLSHKYFSTKRRATNEKSRWQSHYERKSRSTMNGQFKSEFNDCILFALMKIGGHSSEYLSFRMKMPMQHAERLVSLFCC